MMIGRILILLYYATGITVGTYLLWRELTQR